MKKVLKIGRVVSLALVLALFATTAFAEKTLGQLEVEVLYNAFDEDYIRNVVLDDGTKVGDYDYTITYLTDENSFTLSSLAISMYFDYAAWITRDGIVSLSLDPKDNVRFHRDTKTAAWGIVKSPTQGFGSSPNWYNEVSLEAQYDCHFDFATFKDYWNLEPSSTSMTYWEAVLNGCQ